MQPKRNLLVTLADSRYIEQAKQLFSSVYWNAGWKGDYMLLTHDVSEDDLCWFRDKGIIIRKCELLLEQRWGKDKGLSPLIADKYYLFTEEFKIWKNIIYLDSDIIVKAPLESLTKIEYLGAAQDIYFNKLNSQLYDKSKNRFNNKTYNLKTAVFNAGVLSFNTDIITPGLFDELNDLLKNHVSEFIYGEQTALNLCYYKKWKRIPAVYNVFVNYHRLGLKKKINGIILHFAGLAFNAPPPIWNTESPFYAEWKSNREKAELIDLGKVQKIKKWNVFKIIFYSLVLKADYLFIIFKFRLLSSPFYKIVTFFRYIRNLPERILGISGMCIKKFNPALYQKLKKVKNGK
ncbi:MAG TPA: glycosyltransferase [Bacteroidales bacterium]|mgnify:CR=1 FL=1|nr:glycosyltransferase [Bacteroidales bacterium]